jgi:hypothetical protein
MQNENTKMIIDYLKAERNKKGAQQEHMYLSSVALQRFQALKASIIQQASK